MKGIWTIASILFVPIASKSPSLTYYYSLAGTLKTGSKIGSGADKQAGTRDAIVQRPNLDRYRVRPPWAVAGVDYSIGIPEGTVLIPWEIYIQGMSGISVVSSGEITTIIVESTNGVTFKKVDFSSDGGANLYFNHSNNGSIIASNFASITNGDIIGTSSDVSGLTVTNCDIDGEGGRYNGSGLIGAAGGNVIIEYNLMKNFPQHAVELGGGDGVNLNYRFNLILNGGMYPGAHYNVLQNNNPGGNAISTELVEFNTVYQQPQAAGAGEAFQFYDNSTGNTLLSPTLAYNTIIAPASGAMSYIVHGSSGAQYPTAITGTASIHDNYFDPTGAYGVFYPRTFSGWAIANNVNMVTGGTISIR